MNTQQVHADMRYQTLEVVEEWEIRVLGVESAERERFVRHDCAPVQLRHRRTGISLLTATRKTLEQYEAYVPPHVPPSPAVPLDPGGRCCRVFRSPNYEALAEMLRVAFNILVPPAWVFLSYALCDRPTVSTRDQ